MNPDNPEDASSKPSRTISTAPETRSHLQSPAHHRLGVSPVGCELLDKGSAENPERRRPCSGPPPHHHCGGVEEKKTETGEEEETRGVMKSLKNIFFHL